MSANTKTTPTTGRKKLDLGKERSVAAVDHVTPNACCSESAKGFAGIPLPDLPKSWRYASVSEVGTTGEQAVLTGPFGSNLGREDFIDSGTPLLTISCLTDQGIRLDKALFVSAVKAKELQRYRLKTGDLLFSRMASVGRAGIIGPDLEGALFNYHIMRLRLDVTKLLPKFFTGYVRGAKQVRDYLLAVNHGATRDGINTEQLLAMPVIVAPLPEQRRIVAEIEKQFTRLDAGVAALKRVQANLKRYRAAVLKAACEGKLVPTEAELRKNCKTPDFESGADLLKRILEERRKNWTGRGKYKEPATPDTADLPPLREGWTWATVEQLTSLVATGATPYRGNAAYWEDGKIPWVTSGALNETNVLSASEFITPLAIKETNAKVFPIGTLLVALYGEGKTRGKVSELRFEAATNQACAALLFDNSNEVLRSYLRLFLEKNYEDVRLLSSGGVQPNLSLSIVKHTKLPLPPLAEQSRIVAEVERRLSVVEELELVVSANLQRATRLRQSILQKAFNGGLI